MCGMLRAQLRSGCEFLFVNSPKVLCLFGALFFRGPLFSRRPLFICFILLTRPHYYGSPSSNPKYPRIVNGSCLISGSCFTSGETDRAVRADSHAAHVYFTLPWGQGVHAAQKCFSLPWGQGLHFAHLRFSLPWGQGMHSAQSPFIFPWGQGVHAEQ